MEPQDIPQSTQQIPQTQVPQAPAIENMPPSQPVSPPLPKTHFPKLPMPLILGGLAALAVILVGVWAVKMFSGKSFSSRTVELTWWGTMLEQAAVAPILSEYQNKTGVKVTYVKQDKQDYRERLANSLARGEGPDIFEIHNSWTVMFSQQMSLLPTSVLTQEVYKNTFYPVVSTDLARSSSFVGIPLSFDGLALFINTSILDAAGKTAPKDWNEARILAKELAQCEKDGKVISCGEYGAHVARGGIALGSTVNVDHWQDIISLMLLQNKQGPDSPGPKAIESLNFFLGFAKDDMAWDETLPASGEAFARGQTAMYIGPSWEGYRVLKTNPTLNFKVVPVPQLPKTTPAQPNINFASYQVESVWSKSKYTEKAWEFLKFLSSNQTLPTLESNQKAAGGEDFLPSRVDLAGNYSNDPIWGAFTKQAPDAYSSYLSSSTNDGVSGINSRFSAAYNAALQAVEDNKQPTDILATLSTSIKQILASYSTKKK